MALTVAQIAAKAMTAVSAKVSGVIHAATINRVTPGTFDPSTGAITSTTTTDTGRIVFDNQTPATTIFPDYVPGAGEELAFIEGLTTIAPRADDRIQAADRLFTVLRASDLLHSGGLYPLIVRAESA